MKNFNIKFKSLTVGLILMLIILVISPMLTLAVENINDAKEMEEVLIKFKNIDQIFKIEVAVSDSQALIDSYRLMPDVELVEINFSYQMSLVPSDSLYAEQNYLKQINAPLAWNITTGSQEVVVAVLDTGVDINHPDLKNNIWLNEKEIAGNGVDDDQNGYVDDVNGWDFVNSSNDVYPKLFGNYDQTAIKHGTAVAGVAAAEGNNDIGISGVAWRVKIMPLRVLDEQGSGKTDMVAEAINYAVDNGADIINLSFVGSGKSELLEKTIKAAYESGVLVVAAAGNEVGHGQDMDLEEHKVYPACHDGPNGENWVLGVASVDQNEKLSAFSNYGSSCIDLVAVGDRLVSTVYQQDSSNDFKNYYESGWSGTSFSAPQVAAAAALVKSIKPDLSLKQMQNLLKQNARNIDLQNKDFIAKLGGGMLDVYLAVVKAVETQPMKVLGHAEIVTALGATAGPHVKVFKKSYMEEEFLAFDGYYRGGLAVASGDVDGDLVREVVVGVGPGTHPWFRIFDEQGVLKSQWLAYDSDFRGGVEVALADVNGDDRQEIVVGAGVGGGPQVRIFDNQGKVLAQFFAYEENFRGGIEVAAIDVDLDGKDEVVVVSKGGRLNEVRIFEITGELVNSFEVDGGGNGLHVATGDIDGDGFEELIIGAGHYSEPWVKIFNVHGKLINKFLAFGKTFVGGVYVATGDIDGDGRQEIIVGAGVGGGPQVRVFNVDGGVKTQFFAYDENLRTGVRVASD